MDTKLLKQKILDLAIRGKLVPQNPADEPASILLERIKAEKEQLIKEGKIKKEKPLAPIEEVPFEIPESWKWCRLMDISTQILYGVSESAKSSGEYKLLRITDIQNNQVNWDSVPYTDFDIKKVNDYILAPGDILFARTGATVGKSYLVVDTPYTAIYASYLIRVKTSEQLLPNYVKYFFESGYYWEQISDKSIGTGQPNVNGTVLGLLFISIPPLAEQKRIVAEIDRWFKWIDELEKNQQDLHTAIQQAKSKILDLAIHGKLVPQESEWKDVKLKTLASIISGVSYGKGDLTTEGITILRGGNIQDGEIVNCIDDVVISNSFANDNNSVKKGDIVLVASTGSQLLIGKTGYARKDYLKTQIGAFLRIIRPKKMNISDYLHYVFISDYYKNYIRGLAKGTNINNIKSDYLTEFVIPFPSEREQEAIVTKIEELFTQLDKIEESLN